MLARTVLLLRDHFDQSVTDNELVHALTSVSVVVAADRANLATAEGQHALVTAALLSARAGARVSIQIADDVPRLGSQAPLLDTRLGPALSAVLEDLRPDRQSATAESCDIADVAVLIGDTHWRGRACRVLRLQADAWAGAMEGDGGGARWRRFSSPFGPLAAGGLAAGEVYKTAIERLAVHAIDPVAFDLLFAPTQSAMVRLAPTGTPPPHGDLGVFDLVSGGAIIQSALYALGRIPDVSGNGRVIEPERGDETNLNRYALLLRSRLNSFKAEDLADWARSGGLGGIALSSVVARYDAALAKSLAPHAPAILVGVDHIPSRWIVQAARPQWLGIGATTHYSSMASYHTARLACARCLHAHDDPTDGPIPTVAFVSHWAGLWLASLFARARNGGLLDASQQSVFMTSLRAESAASTWFSPVAPRIDCPLGCAA